MKFNRRNISAHWVLLIGLAVLALQGCSDNSTTPETDESAQTDSGISLTVIPHAQNTLMAIASVVSDSAGTAAIIFSSEGTADRASQWVEIEADEPVDIAPIAVRFAIP